jgi:hypothetical protein
MINMIINCETGEITNVETPDEVTETQAPTE